MNTRRKRLQHVADTMCQMFCGWRLHGSKLSLVELGSGTLEIDALTGNCSFQGTPTDKLTIAEEICAWVREDLAANNIPVEALNGARLFVKLSFSVMPWSAPKNEIFYSEGAATRTEKMNCCLIECDSQVTTDEVVYRSHRQETQQWPIGWPETTNG